MNIFGTHTVHKIRKLSEGVATCYCGMEKAFVNGTHAAVTCGSCIAEYSRIPRRGRPVGHKLSKTTKQQIAKSKTGYKHDEATKQAISTTLLSYFKKHGTHGGHIRQPATPEEVFYNNLKWLAERFVVWAMEPFRVADPSRWSTIRRNALNKMQYCVRKDMIHLMEPRIAKWIIEKVFYAYDHSYNDVSARPARIQAALNDIKRQLLAVV